MTDPNTDCVMTPEEQKQEYKQNHRKRKHAKRNLAEHTKQLWNLLAELDESPEKRIVACIVWWDWVSDFAPANFTASVCPDFLDYVRSSGTYVYTPELAEEVKWLLVAQFGYSPT